RQGTGSASLNLTATPTYIEREPGLSSHSSVNKHRHQQRWRRPRVAGEATLHQSFRAGFQIAPVAFEEKLSTRCPAAAVAPARARVVAFLGQCSGHRNNDRVINTLPYSVEVCFATALKLAFDAAVDWITPRHVTGAARFWRDRDAPDLVSELVRYHRMASFVVGDGLASR